MKSVALNRKLLLGLVIIRLGLSFQGIISIAPTTNLGRSLQEQSTMMIRLAMSSSSSESSSSRQSHDSKVEGPSDKEPFLDRQRIGPTTFHTTSRRQVFLQALLTMGTTTWIGSDSAHATLVWQKDPINKRSGVKVIDAERAGYNLPFVTYLTRFLLSFDPPTQKYWFKQLQQQQQNNKDIMDTDEAITPDELFAKLAASVEIGLQLYLDKDGPARLLAELSSRYGQEEGGTKRQKREAKEARRQLALLFALLEDRQPVAEISQLLATIDNGRIVNVNMTESFILTGNTTTSMAPSSSSSSLYYVIVPPPPATGYIRAQGEAIFERTGRILALKVMDGGSGYETPPTVRIGDVEVPSKVTIQGGKVTKIELLTSNITSIASDPLDTNVTIVGPTATTDGITATVLAIPEFTLQRIDITNPGSGYLVEKPVPIYLSTDALAKNATAEEIKTLYEKKQLQLVGKAFPQAEKSSYTSFRNKIEDDNDDPTTILESTGVKASATGPDDGLPPLPFWSEKSSSSDLLRLLPTGIGLEYDRTLKRYVLAVDKDYQKAYPAAAFRPQGGGRPLGPEFGPRGRAPIEKNMVYTTDVLLRFALSGAICASGVHLALTPLDVVKTKVQTNPERYPNVPVSFGRVYREEGISTFFSGWLPTVVGNFCSGGALYLLTEVIRKYLTEAAGPMATTYEVPIILAAAATASAFGAAISCPFETVRIRGVAKPDYAPNSVAVLQRIIKEDGIFSLVNTIPVFLVKNVPYAMTKFTIFDLSTERLFAAIPAAQEELRLSLLISLIGGILGGTAAAVVSNPADALISELKKSKTTGKGPIDVAKDMWKRGDNGPVLFLKGLGLRMVFYSLIASLQFCAYDFVRFSLGIGPDDLKLYLDVLGGALDRPPG